ncbi:aldehyde dehydrogenase family protein [Rhodobacteraceae bacterium N5(2021)]|uniref:Aldehyde dehydrogenase family protein n=1 Tax=Gymnodinialimonas phycosphaerae TaxID=2841589 RepID=A0A975TW76_9RHOB|nr:aldehyde dehydrogenase family protein [Gymnodinialimonas phycosphaerae]MBY4891816.1 aldehyde dehydrogenase family protein [Gymnodinialimonas phycosphaerae]
MTLLSRISIFFARFLGRRVNGPRFTVSGCGTPRCHGKACCGNGGGHLVSVAKPALGTLQTSGTHVAPSSSHSVETATSAAASAFADWSHRPIAERARTIASMADLLEDRRGDLYAVAEEELGATRSWIDFNIDLAKGILKHVASLGPALEDKTVVHGTPETRSIIRRQAAGVVLGLVPWNAPITLGVRAVAGPLMCGNTVVMKGSDICPRTHQLLVDILNGSGLPEGALSCVVGTQDDAHDIMVALIADPCVRRINFTGSTRVGRDVAIEAARHLKPALLELSGKAPLIVLEDADLDAAVEAACFGAYFNQGQICMSTEWIIVVHSIADTFVSKLTSRVAQLAAETGPDRGRMISAKAVERVRALVEDAVSKGARLLVGGETAADQMQPTLLDGIASNMRVFREETFGPLASVMRVQDAEEAISIANASDYGLNAAIFTADLNRAQAMAETLEYGVVQINGPTVHDDPAMPFGGMKLSGHGRFGGESVIHEFTEQRWIAIHEVGSTPRL